MSNLDKPMPVPTPTSKPFWEGLAQEKVRIQHCEACQGWVFYPRSRCSHCWSDALQWRDVSGEGSLYTFTVSSQPTAPHFADEVPQRLAVVELNEGVRMTTTLVNVPDSAIKAGMRVKPFFDHVSADATLLRFQPA